MFFHSLISCQAQVQVVPVVRHGEELGASGLHDLVIAAVATSNLHVIFGFGLLRGNGVGITMTNNIIVINQYFNKLQRPHFLFILTANSVCMTVMLLQMSEVGLLADARQFSVAEKANLFTIIMTFDIFAKIAQGLIIDLPPIKRLFQFPMKFLYRFNAACMAVTMVGLALADTFIELSVLGCIVAFFNANIMINFSQILR